MGPRVLLDEALEGLFQGACPCGRSTGAGPIAQALGAWVGKAIDPLAEGGSGKRERLGDGLQAGPLDDFADRLSATEAPSLSRLLQHRIPSWEGVSGQVERKGAHGRALA